MINTYSTSEEFISKIKQNYKYMLIAMPLGMVAMAIYFIMGGMDSDIPLFIGIFVVISLVLELEIWILSRVMLKKIEQNQIIIGEDFIQRKTRNLEDPIYFETIKKIHIKREKKGKISYIDLSTERKKMRLYGIESLEEIANILEENKGDISIKEDSLKMNYDNPVVYGVIFAVTLGIFIFLEDLKGLPVSDLITGAMAIWMLFFKPVSKAQGKRFRIVEIVIGAVLIVCLAMRYILYYI